MLSRRALQLLFREKSPSIALQRSIHNVPDIQKQIDELTVDAANSPVVILFPGQGSQFVGMAKTLVQIPEAKQLFDRASEILKYDLAELCNNGPDYQLNETVHCQPALLVTSLATLQLLKGIRPDYTKRCIGTAGFSLGEITSLVLAEAISFDNAVELVRIRAEAMQKCCEQIKGGMVAVVLKDNGSSELDVACERAKKWCIDCGIEAAECAISNDLYPNCKVVAGHEEAIKYLRMNARTYNLSKLLPINAHGAFHTKLMQRAIQPVSEALKSVHIKQPLFPVYSNVTAKPYENESEIRELLPQQIVQPVKWEQSMQNIFAAYRANDSYPVTYACGPGLVLLKNLRKIDERAWKKAIKVGE